MGIVDFHNHLIPGVDDGAQTPEESSEALAIMRRDGVSTVVATPHIDASVTADPQQLKRRLAELDAGWQILKQCSTDSGVRVERGAELLLDIPEPDLSDNRLRLAGGKFLLMEFPFMTIPPHSARAVRAIADRGYCPIIAHPERYHGIGEQIDLAGEWKQSGAYLQVNGGSLLGRYGRAAYIAAFELLARGWADYICSDYHARGPALVAEYRALLEKSDAAEQAHTLMETNPTRMLGGLAPLPTFPVRRRREALWRRVAALLRL